MVEISSALRALADRIDRMPVVYSSFRADGTTGNCGTIVVGHAAKRAIVGALRARDEPVVVNEIIASGLRKHTGWSDADFAALGVQEGGGTQTT